MIIPKTDWLPSDRFNLADYIRITNNLNHPKVIGGLPVQVFPELALGDLISYSTYLKILNCYNSISVIAKFPAFPEIEDRRAWFDFHELNLIEGLCLHAMLRYDKYDKYGTGNHYGAKIYGGGFFG